MAWEHGEVSLVGNHVLRISVGHVTYPHVIPFVQVRIDDVGAHVPVTIVACLHSTNHYAVIYQFHAHPHRGGALQHGEGEFIDTGYRCTEGTMANVVSPAHVCDDFVEDDWLMSAEARDILGESRRKGNHSACRALTEGCKIIK